MSNFSLREHWKQEHKDINDDDDDDDDDAVVSSQVYYHSGELSLAIKCLCQSGRASSQLSCAQEIQAVACQTPVVDIVDTCGRHSKDL